MFTRQKKIQKCGSSVHFPHFSNYSLFEHSYLKMKSHLPGNSFNSGTSSLQFVDVQPPKLDNDTDSDRSDIDGDYYPSDDAHNGGPTHSRSTRSHTKSKAKSKAKPKAKCKSRSKARNRRKTKQNASKANANHGSFVTREHSGDPTHITITFPSLNNTIDSITLPKRM